RLWYWRHRWFIPLQTEEVLVDIAPTGEIVAFHHRIPEERPIADPTAPGAKQLASAFLERVGQRPEQLLFLSESSRRLPQRIERTFIWESRTIRPAGAPYRYTVTLDGDRVSRYSQRLKVPDQWVRDYRDLRSKNEAAGGVDTVFMFFTTLAAIGIFLTRLRRGDIQLRFVMTVGAVAIALVAAVAINSYPSAVADYDTSDSWPSFITQQVVFTALQSLGAALLLIAVVGSGDALYRERFPSHLALPLLWRRSAVRSKRVFKSFVLGYTLVPLFIAFQIAFYLIATRFGAWSPADIPYSEILNSRFPWAAVLFMGFFPAFSEEYLSRAFSIPLFEKLLRSPLAAIVLAGFIWGFGHAAYPNQPFYIRGVEVGIAGVVIGLMMMRFGLLPLLIWHYTIDAIYTALLLFRSNNSYYIVSAAIASLVFLIPIAAGLFFYFRHGGFESDESLSNSAIPAVKLPPLIEETAVVTAPTANFPITRRLAITSLILAAGALVLLFLKAPEISDVIDYRIDSAAAITIARSHLTRVMRVETPPHVVAVPTEGFRSWNSQSGREDGGSPGGFSSVSAEYLIRKGVSIPSLRDTLAARIEAATWMVRFYAPLQKNEILIEVDPRSERAVGIHRYLEETSSGPRLTRDQASRIATDAFRMYALDPATYVLKESLSFQQPARLDWLFHFEQRIPLAAEAFGRVSVRVVGDQVSQFAKTIKIPEREVRDASRQTLINTTLMILRIAGVLGLLSVVVMGAVGAFRGGFRWRGPLRATLLVAIAPILAALSDLDLLLSRYDTSIAWETFVVGMVVGLFMRATLQLLLIFLALAVLDALIPSARKMATKAALGSSGGSAALAAIGAIAFTIAIQLLLSMVTARWPAAVTLSSFTVPSFVATTLPLLTTFWNALFAAIIGSAILAAIAGSRDIPLLRGWRLETFVLGALFLTNLDSSVRPDQLPLMLVESAVVVVTAFVVVRYLLGSNLLAYPVMIFLTVLLRTAAAMLQNQRSDLQIQGWSLIAIA
ncbi:MAG TPA: type II CAAX endopeptidase family protein, partial [Thermoanaerobaculia bacterium]|nr:type II CAAX endopeptidase family protein [Thermoanaerobaculia bacterium]